MLPHQAPQRPLNTLFDLHMLSSFGASRNRFKLSTSDYVRPCMSLSRNAQPRGPSQACLVFCSPSHPRPSLPSSPFSPWTSSQTCLFILLLVFTPLKVVQIFRNQCCTSLLLFWDQNPPVFKMTSNDSMTKELYLIPCALLLGSYLILGVLYPIHLISQQGL